MKRIIFAFLMMPLSIMAQQTYQALGMHESHYLMYEEEL